MMSEEKKSHSNFPPVMVAETVMVYDKWKFMNFETFHS